MQVWLRIFLVLRILSSMLRVACIRLYIATIGEQEQFTTDSEAFGSVKGVFVYRVCLCLCKNKRYYALLEAMCFIHYGYPYFISMFVTNSPKKRLEKAIYVKLFAVTTWYGLPWPTIPCIIVMLYMIN